MQSHVADSLPPPTTSSLASPPVTHASTPPSYRASVLPGLRARLASVSPPPSEPDLRCLVAIVVDVTSLGHAEPYMRHLLETAVAPGVKTLAVNFDVSKRSSQYARYIVVETGGYEGTSGFVARTGQFTSDVDAVIHRMQNLKDRGGGTHGFALGDGLMAAGEALLNAGTVETERHVVVVAGTSPLERTQTSSPRFEPGMECEDVARRLAGHGVFLSTFATRDFKALQSVFEAHRAAIQQRLHPAQLSEQFFRGCVMRSQIPKRPDTALSHGRHRKVQLQTSPAKRARTDSSSGSTRPVPSGPTAFITEHKFWSNAAWSGGVSWDMVKALSASKPLVRSPNRIAKVQLTAFRSKSAAASADKFTWNDDVEVTNFVPLSKVLPYILPGKDLNSKSAASFLQFRPTTSDEVNKSRYAWLVQCHQREQQAGVILVHGKSSKDTLITFAGGDVLYGFYVPATTPKTHAAPRTSAAVAPPSTTVRRTYPVASTSTQNGVHRHATGSTVTAHPSVAFSASSEALQQLQQSASAIPAPHARTPAIESTTPARPFDALKPPATYAAPATSTALASASAAVPAMAAASGRPRTGSGTTTTTTTTLPTPRTAMPAAVATLPPPTAFVPRPLPTSMAMTTDLGGALDDAMSLPMGGMGGGGALAGGDPGMTALFTSDQVDLLGDWDPTSDLFGNLEGDTGMSLESVMSLLQ
eukprot:m.163079 g.163079  ORF g.163079 m.163079 type:complete len:700 (+) comp12271_c0_seq1:164-2263(+)